MNDSSEAWFPAHEDEPAGHHGTNPQDSEGLSCAHIDAYSQDPHSEAEPAQPRLDSRARWNRGDDHVTPDEIAYIGARQPFRLQASVQEWTTMR